MTHDLQKGFTKIGNALRGVQWVCTYYILLKKREKEPSPIQTFFWGGCRQETSTDTFQAILFRFDQTDHSFFQFLIRCSTTCCMYHIVSLVRHVSWCIDSSFLAKANLLSSKARLARKDLLIPNSVNLANDAVGISFSCDQKVTTSTLNRRHVELKDLKTWPCAVHMSKVSIMLIMAISSYDCSHTSHLLTTNECRECRKCGWLPGSSHTFLLLLLWVANKLGFLPESRNAIIGATLPGVSKCGCATRKCCPCIAAETAIIASWLRNLPRYRTLEECIWLVWLLLHLILQLGRMICEASPRHDTLIHEVLEGEVSDSWDSQDKFKWPSDLKWILQEILPCVFLFLQWLQHPSTSEASCLQISPCFPSAAVLRLAKTCAVLMRGTGGNTLWKQCKRKKCK